ncbi:hypothetical protein SAMN05444358_101289 [Ruegeria halocynthiae]|uniref:Secreted protein n=1 Tax=Ruegeria halocynthiae TaxID=985054 RepID=A0A1H2RWW4_9RHOB|nr:hypothetical protein [Ruegeria halocynthiae]SDW23787.1 hypothetical protein SAMN05444358_101289 [Ruegeria halocynthiae]
MKHFISPAFAVLIMATFPAAVAAAPNGYRTEPMSGTEFEVIPRSRQDIDGYWCAAADFARRTLGAGWQQQIYVLRGYGPSVTTGRKTAVQFTLTPPANADQQSSFSVGFQPGSSMSVQGANGRCGRSIVLN